MADTMTKLTRDQFIPFLDVDKDLTFASPEWKRIDYSTIFELSVGEQEEDRDYICFASAVTDVDSNKPELPQEIAIYEGNPMYDFFIGEFYNLPVGQDCKTGCLICFGGTGKKAWQGTVTITEKTLNTVDGVVTFTLKWGGDIAKGTYTITDGVPTFTPVTP
jgi:hypothetical protein